MQTTCVGRLRESDVLALSLARVNGTEVALGHISFGAFGLRLWAFSTLDGTTDAMSLANPLPEVVDATGPKCADRELTLILRLEPGMASDYAKRGFGEEMRLMPSGGCIYPTTASV